MSAATSSPSASAAVAGAATTKKAALPAGPIVSVFDFDGTLFKSPAPTSAMERQYPNLAQPYENKGLGWFQNTRSMHPPYVPAVVTDVASSSQINFKNIIKKTPPPPPTAGGKRRFQEVFDSYAAATAAVAKPSAAVPADSFDRWFIAPTAAAYHEAKERGDITAILTGRELQPFHQRVTELLEGAGLTFDHIFLKHKPGTVGFKVEAFVELITTYQPSKVVYYEDRPDQGKKIERVFKAAVENGALSAMAAGLGEEMGSPSPSAGEGEMAAGAKKGSGGEKDSHTRRIIEHYTSLDGFEVVMVPHALSNTYLPSAVEAQLLAELVADAEAAGVPVSGGGRVGAGDSRGRGRGGQEQTRGGGGGRGKR